MVVFLINNVNTQTTYFTLVVYSIIKNYSSTYVLYYLITYKSLSRYVCGYMYMCLCICVYIYTHQITMPIGVKCWNEHLSCYIHYFSKQEDTLPALSGWRKALPFLTLSHPALSFVAPNKPLQAQFFLSVTLVLIDLHDVRGERYTCAKCEMNIHIYIEKECML